MPLVPSRIYRDLKTKHLDKQSAIRFLLTLIESSENNSIRLESIKYLNMIGIESDRFYALFENLLISDLSREIRIRAAQILKEKFSSKALIPIKWAIQHETDYECLITFVNTLKDINNEESTKILIEELKKIRKRKYIDENKNYNNKSFKKSLKKLFTKKNLNALTNRELAEIIINYKTIRALIHKFYTIFFEWENGLITSLDLSEIGWNIWNVWRQKYSDRIIDISEIVGLRNLSFLKTLDLSNNRIKYIKDLLKLKNLTHLYLANNRIEDSKNIEYIKKMTNLRHLDLSGNKIVRAIDKKDFTNLDITLFKGLPPLV